MLTAILSTLLVVLVVVLSVDHLVDPAPPRSRSCTIECDAPIDELMPSLAGLTLGTAVDGNSVEVLENGAFFDVLLERHRARRAHSVHFETFLWKEGELGQRVADALCERAPRRACTVRVLLDANGSKKMGEASRAQLRDAGCQVVKFHHRSAAQHRRAQRPRPPQARACSTAATRSSAATASSTTGSATREDGEHYADVSVRLHGPDRRTACRRRSARTGSARPASCSSATTSSRARAGGDVPIHVAYRQARGLGAGGEDPAPRGHLPGAQADLDPESLLHPRARGDRGVRRGRWSAASTCA